MRRRAVFWEAMLGFAYGAQWIGLRYLFNFAQQKWEASMLENGLAVVWWSIFLSYFLVNTTILVLFVFVGTKLRSSPFGSACPFRYVASDVVILAVFLHLYLLCVDHAVYIHLEALGLHRFCMLFLIVGAVWLSIAILRARSLGHSTRSSSVLSTSRPV